MYQFILEIDKKYSDEIATLLRENSIVPRFYIRKGVIPAELISDIIFITAASLNIIDILRRWYKEHKIEGTKMKMYKYDETKIIHMGDEITEFETKSIEEIEKELTHKV
jgi:hypothetical protein